MFPNKSPIEIKRYIMENNAYNKLVSILEVYLTMKIQTPLISRVQNV